MQEKEALMHCNPTRRTFLKGTAATAALAAVGTCSVAAWRAEQAEAAATGAVKIQGASLCNGCSSKCGLIATALDGRLWTVEGMKEHPYSKGTLCGRGHGAAQWAYSDGRLTQPMKRAADGSFAPISWDDALSEIGAKVQEIIAEAGPEALAIIQDPRPSGKYYSKRFMNALGSPNVYTHAAACNLSKESGIQEATGAQNFSVDFPNTKMVVFIGRSYGDGIRPSSVKSLAGAAEGGARVVIVDPRLNNTGVFATDWVPIRPGADIAFLLGIANVLVTRDLYDHAFVEQSAVGFPEFAAQVTEYTPEWAEGICDVPADTIVEIAESLAAAAPACAIEPSWRAAFGCAYQNSFETARAVCAVNALLGCWGQKGGALITSSPKAGDVDPVKFPEVPKPAAKRLGDAEYPLALSGTGTNLAVLNGCADGVIQGVFFLIGGKQGIHSHTMTLNLEALNAISREYQLERLWMAASDAADLGIADGDTVELSSSECSGQVAVKVTERLKPGVLFLPTHYGGTSPYLTRAQGFGLNMMDFVPLHLEPGVGSTMSQEVAVKVRKVEG